MLQRTVPAWRGPVRPATVFTIHNLAYQGIFDASWLPRLGLGYDLMRMDALEYWNRISFLKSGIVFSGIITTVSPRYAEEIQTPELGFGFDGILRARSADLVGILNGIDYDQWDPERDLNLPVPFSASKMAGKAAAKRRVLEAFGLPRSPDEPTPSAGGHDLETGRSEGVRPAGSRSLTRCRLWAHRSCCSARVSLASKPVAGAGRSAPGAHWCANRVRRRVGASH